MRLTDLRSILLNLRAQRRARKARRGQHHRSALTNGQRLAVLSKTGRKCHICGGSIDNDAWQADHVMAHSAGGLHEIDNYLPAHALCNNYRWDYLPEEFQLILKLGVWARTQIERQTVVGGAIEVGFSDYEVRRAKRRKPRPVVVGASDIRTKWTRD